MSSEVNVGRKLKKKLEVMKRNSRSLKTLGPYVYIKHILPIF
jgi:hypothetical protein